MDWDFEPLYNKAKLFCQRAHDLPIESPLFGFWMSLALELLSRSALAFIHPVLLADPKESDNIHYVFGVNPKGPPRSILAKTVFARCSVLVPGFTDKMSAHCLTLAERRNAELHSGAPAFEGLDNARWLPATYEVFDILLSHIKKSFVDLLGTDHGNTATAMLADRHESIEKEVKDQLSKLSKDFQSLTAEAQAQQRETATTTVSAWIRSHRSVKKVACPACGSSAGISGEVTGRSPANIDESVGVIVREVRLLPNALRCPACGLQLDGYQHLKAAGLGSLFSVSEKEDPIEYFGIVPEEHVDIDALVSDHLASLAEEDGYYLNE